MKKNIKFLCASFLMGLSIIPFASCGEKVDNGNKEDYKISLNETMLEMNVGETYELKVTITPDDPKEKNIEWKSKDSAIASVDKGTVTAKAEGETVITATSNGKSDSCKITVKPNVDENDKDPDGKPDDNEMPDGGTPESDGSAEK